jgi:hypothetical protein
MLVKNNKRSAGEQVVEQLRRDIRVRQALDPLLRWPLDLPNLVLSDRFYSDQDALIMMIAEIYEEVTGKSPRTTDPLSGKRPFDRFVIELFKREGLDPPTTYAIRQATKKNK